VLFLVLPATAHASWLLDNIPTPVLWLAATTPLLALAGWAISFPFRRRARLRRSLIASKTTQIRLAARRNLCTAIILSPSSGGATPAERFDAWLSGLDFRTTPVTNLEVFLRAVDFTPTVTVVDCAIAQDIADQIEEHFSSHRLSASATVIFFNAPAAVRSRDWGFLKNVHIIGETFTRPDLIAIVAPLLVAEDSAATRRRTAFEGEINPATLANLLEFAEIGSRTGVLTIRDHAYRVVGLMGFERGIIRAAQTQGFRGKDAVMELVRIRKGFFQFRSEAPAVERTCEIVPTAVLLELAKQQDEDCRDGIVALDAVALE
jgi:hypothetical protein